MTERPVHPVQASRDARHAYWAEHGSRGNDVDGERQADLAYNTALAAWPYKTDAKPRTIQERKTV